MVERDTTPSEDDWRARITGAAGVRFTGYKRYHLYKAVTRSAPRQRRAAAGGAN
jgi:hypothetical protein